MEMLSVLHLDPGPVFPVCMHTPLFLSALLLKLSPLLFFSSLSRGSWSHFALTSEGLRIYHHYQPQWPTDRCGVKTLPLASGQCWEVLILPCWIRPTLCGFGLFAFLVLLPSLLYLSPLESLHNKSLARESSSQSCFWGYWPYELSELNLIKPN